MRVHLVFRPREGSDIHWNHEAEPMRVWFESAEGADLSARFVEIPNDPTRPVTVGDRTAGVELRPTDAAAGRNSIRVRGYALFNACDGEDGVCRFLRKDFECEIPESVSRSRR